MGNKNMKKEDYLSWDEYFMGVAILSGDAFQGSQLPGRIMYRQRG